MNLEYAVDRLYDAGWMPGSDPDIETLANGRRFPSLDAIQREFAQAGLTLQIAHKSEFNCYRASWSPVTDVLNAMRDDRDPAERYGTVIGACEREAAVYALAQLRESQARLRRTRSPVEQSRELAMA
jgi:hypothetical protein